MKQVLVAALIAVGLTACSSGKHPAPLAGSPVPNARSTASSAAPTSTPHPTRSPARRALTQTPAASPVATHQCAAVGAGTYAMTLAGRRVRVTIPVGFDGRHRLPVAIAYHGYGGSADGFDAYTALPSFVAHRAIVLATPQGTGSPAEWNFPQRAAIGPDDVAFTAALLDALAARLCTQPTGALATGWSDGADMAVTVACALPGRFAAVGLVSASTAPPAGCRGPITVIAAHGTDDRIEPYAGGAPDGRPGYGGITSVGPEQAATAWSRLNHCATGPTRAPVTAHVTRLSWHGCGIAQVSLYRIEGGGHTWPGATYDRPDLGPTTREINAGTLILDAWRALG